MAEINVNKTTRRWHVRHRGRGAQVWIYLGKLLRMFLYQSDWKVVPMAALIAGLVGMVIRKRLFINMEGALMGSFAMACVAIWNGCFNSIQVVCRERDVIKREHRSGMHISSYIFAHMLYQALLCLLQTGVTIYVTKLVGVRYDLAKPLITPWFLVDFGISMFLITYASDMMSLWISTIAHTTTTAMTIMPFVLIFQLVFSGGMLTLPAWATPLTHFTISNPGLKVLTTQADRNHLPMVTLWDTLVKLDNSEVGGTVTVGQVLDVLSNADSEAVQQLRAMEVGKVLTLGEIGQMLESSSTFQQFRQEAVLENMTVGDALTHLKDMDELKPYLNKKLIPGLDFTIGGLLSALINEPDLKPLMDRQLTQTTTVGDVIDIVKKTGVLEQYSDVQIGGVTTVGEIVDAVAANGDVQAMRDRSFTFKSTVGKLLDLLGRDRVKAILEAKAAEASYKPEYDYTLDNVLDYWLLLTGFVLAFAALATITLEFIDRDKR